MLVLPSLHWVAWSDFPSFTGTLEYSDSSSLVWNPSVDSGSLTHAWLLRSLRDQVQPKPGRSQVFSHRVTVPGSCTGREEVSQVPGEPRWYACPAL